MFKSGIVGDYLLPLVVVSVVGMMVFPLPPTVLDFLLMLNITFAIALLISTVYLKESDNFTSLPSILLLTTLCRLGLNISTTRQVLSGNDTPQIVSAFGHFVVGSNLVVGIVIFIIITIVQFIVISKGAERIAEVAARFTLDAMPGKQMAIDADVRAGLLSLADAKAKRIELHRESKLYGALDGAMKFVKGDAIAGLLITLLNITAGLALGVSQQGLGIKEAVQKYSLLTVGDGLVSQIPALLVAVAAGIAVSRVADCEDSYIGRDIIRQMTKEPRTLGVVSIVLLALSFVPTLPTFLFLSAATFSAALGYRAKKLSITSTQNEVDATFKPKVYSALVLKLSVDAALELQKNIDFLLEVQKIRQNIFQSWGVIVPEIELDVDLDIGGISTIIFLNGIKEFELNLNATESKCSEIIQRHINEFIGNHIIDFLNDTQIRLLLETYTSRCEDLINSVVPEVISVTGLTTLMRELIKEEVSLKEFPTILQAIAEFKFKSEGGNIGVSGEINNARVLKQLSSWEQTESLNQRNADLLAEVRIAIRRTICEKLLAQKNELATIVVDPLLDRIFSVAGFNQSPITPSLIEELNKKLESLIKEVGEENIALVSSKFARLCLAKTMRPKFPKLSILAHDEIPENVKVVVLGVIGGDAKETKNEKNIDSLMEITPEAIAA